MDIPRLGVTGAAVTNVFSQALGAGLGMWFLLAGYTRLHLNMSHFRFDPGTIWRMVKVGIPASVTGMERTFGQLILMWLVVPFGTVAVAAHTVGQRIDQLVNNPFMAFGQAAGIIAGQNLGAGEPKRAEKRAGLPSSCLRPCCWPSPWYSFSGLSGRFVYSVQALTLWTGQAPTSGYR